MGGDQEKRIVTVCRAECPEAANTVVTGLSGLRSEMKKQRPLGFQILPTRTGMMFSGRNGDGDEGWFPECSDPCDV
jgi:hypothetical protein